MSKEAREEGAERARQGSSVLRCIRENPGLSARDLAARLGGWTARRVRERIRDLRARGANIVIGTSGSGYYDLDGIQDAEARARAVRAHLGRTRQYLLDHVTLLKQIGGMTATAIAQGLLFDLTVPEEAGDEARPVSMEDLARLPASRRSGVLRLLVSVLDGIARDPTAFAVERAYLADRFGRIFITKREAAKLAEARRLLEEIGV
jgi:hypothetical protein